LRVIQDFADLGFAPSVRELAIELDLASTSSVARLLGQLRDRGFISWLPGRHRSITITCRIPPTPTPEPIFVRLFTPTPGQLVHL
jgi:SOS-response transcriptional repressor LexA